MTGEKLTLKEIKCSKKHDDFDLEERAQDIINELQFKKLNFCSCGCPEEINDMIENILKSREIYSDNLKNLGYDEATKILDDSLETSLGFKSSSVLYEFVLKTLSNAGVLEHGGSIYSSWLTDYAKELLYAYDVLREIN